MALILNIETTTDVCSVCLSQEEKILTKAFTDVPFQHAARITRLIEQCFQSAHLPMSKLEAIAISQGPGSYTALRIGISAAKGIAYGLDIPLIAIDTLQALAMAASRKFGGEALYHPMIDARRMEVYTAPFDRNGKALGPARSMIIDSNSFEEEVQAGQMIILSGNGAAKCKAILPSAQIQDLNIFCDSEYLVSLAQTAFRQQNFVDMAYFTPVYLKPPNITISKKKL